MTRTCMRWIVAAAVLCVSPSLPSNSASRPAPRRAAHVSPRTTVSLDAGWLRHTMPEFDLWPPSPRLTSAQIQQLRCPGADQKWAPVNLPDDYVVQGDISREPNASFLVGHTPDTKTTGHGRSQYGGHGYLPVYPAWYRRDVLIPGSARGKSVWLDFGGIYRDAVVFVNGKFLEEHPSGYTGFRIDISSVVRFGEKNSIAVFVDPRWFEGWWYEGGGIYRHASLIFADKLHVAPWGTFVNAIVPGPIEHDSRGVGRAAASLAIETTVRNDGKTARSFTLRSEVLDAAGRLVASASSNERLPAGGEETFHQNASVQSALLWSLEHRNLYKLATYLREGNAATDEKVTTFGIRTLRFDPDRGFFLNGRHVQIQGVCSHQDFPGVGIAAPDNLWGWRIEKLKAMGVNAYRCSHNPVSEAFYRACDRMGMLVMDENRHLGDTYSRKTTQGTPYSDLSDLKDMVLQHRNHPSIFMWSMCNEEGLQKTPYGAKIFAAMKEAVKSIDPTRPTTSAMNGGYNEEGFLSVEDVFGMNYHESTFAQVHARFPKLLLYGSENLNSFSSRGTITSSPDTALCSLYGYGYGPGDTPPPKTSFFHAHQPWLSWAEVMKHPFVAGQFVWTAIDYRGEPNPFSWPAVTSQTGSMDLCGFPKPDYYYWKAWWRKEPSVYIFPDWNLPKEETGKTVLVRAFSNCERVELFLNGKSLGSQKMTPYQYLDWNVPYAPGSLKAVGYNHGRAAAAYTVRTPGKPAALRLASDFRYIPANGQAVAPIRVSVVDASGLVVPDAGNLIQFSVKGAGELAGVANGNPASHEANIASQREAFRGLCMVLVRAKDRSGAIIVKAEAHGLRPATIVIHTAPESHSRH